MDTGAYTGAHLGVHTASTRGDRWTVATRIACDTTELPVVRFVRSTSVITTVTMLKIQSDASRQRDIVRQIAVHLKSDGILGIKTADPVFDLHTYRKPF